MTQFVTAEIPRELRECDRAPSWALMKARARKSVGYASQADVAQFVALLSMAHQDCSVKLAAVNHLLSSFEARTLRSQSPPKRKLFRRGVR